MGDRCFDEKQYVNKLEPEDMSLEVELSPMILLVMAYHA